MTPDTIQNLFLSRAVEEADSRGEKIPFSEREEATRQALAVTGGLGDPVVGEKISDRQWRFLAERSGFLRHRAQGVVGAMAVPFSTGRLGAGLCLAAFVFGFASHVVGLGESFDLLALPMMLILLWNAVVYVVWLYGLTRTHGTDERHGFIARLVWRKMYALDAGQPENKARKAYLNSIATWVRSWGVPTVASWFHASSACFVIGLLSAIYIRGINQEYLAGWESTWLSARGVSLVVGGLLAPASWIAGIPLPDTPEDWNHLKRSAASAGENAGPWIHLYAVTLLGWIVLPRLVLSSMAAIRAGRLRATPPEWDSGEPYLRRILSLARQDGDFSIAILPFDIKSAGFMRDGVYRDAFERLVRETWGLRARPCWLECAAYGDEDGIFEGAWADAVACEGAVLLLDMHATAEEEVHGALLDAVLKRYGAGRGGVLTVLETARFHPDRYPSRLDLWQQLASKRKAKILPVDAAAVRDAALPPSSLVYTSH